MPGAIGVNLRVTGHSSQGGRKYMEDFFSVAYQHSEDERDLEYAFFGIFDGHGGAEAAAFAKEHLMRLIVNQKQFWSDNDADVLRAIREGYIATHKAMWREQEKWPRTATGLPSTAGTTATVAFIRHGKMYIGHVGDSGIVLGYQEPEAALDWKAKPLTQDHKPECNIERARITNSGGKVVAKSGVSRVVWTRPRLGHKGPIRRSTPIDEIPFLAVARSLGDLWSYNSQRNEFVVSPEPDVHVINIDQNFRCLVFGTDGLWNVLSPNAAVDIVRNAEYVNDRNYYSSKELLNPSRCLVNRALEKWSTTRIRADNTSVVTILLDPPGGPKRRREGYAAHSAPSLVNRPMVGGVGGLAGCTSSSTMDEECLNDPGGVANRERRPLQIAANRNVEEELDMLNESLYNHTHQFNQHHHHNHSGLMDTGGNFNPLHSPFGNSSSGHHHSSYENYMNLSGTPQTTAAAPPPGGFLQYHLQGTHQQLLAMALPFSGYDLEAADQDQPQYHHSNLGPSYSQNLPTFSNLMEDTYSLTRLETRMEQLTNNAVAGSSLYANYQQLIETTATGSLNYCPQIDLNTINTFHDYAGNPMQAVNCDAFEEMPTTTAVGDSCGGEGGVAMEERTTAINDANGGGDLNYSMEHEKFAWSQEWHEEQPMAVSVAVPANHLRDNQPAIVQECDQEMPTSSNSNSSSSSSSSTDDDLQIENPPVEPGAKDPGQTIAKEEALPFIQINEITSSGVVQTPPPPSMISPSPCPIVASEETVTEEESPTKTKVKQNLVQQVKVVNQMIRRGSKRKASSTAEDDHSNNNENLRRRLRCQSTKEKENKSHEPTTPKSLARETRRLRIVATTTNTTEEATLTVATRSTSVSSACVSTRKSTAAARNSVAAALRSKQQQQPPAMATTATVRTKGGDKLIKCNTSKRNLLINSSNFNQQKELVKEVVSSTSSSPVVGGVGRRLSKRDKVKTRMTTAAISTGVTTTTAAPASWRNVTKSTVQTRNRVQKR